MAIRTGLLLALACILLAGPTAAQDGAKRLVVGTKESAPFSMKDAHGEWHGISIGLWRAVAQELDLDYEVREFDLDGLLAATAGGEVDVAVAALSTTPEREAKLDFTHPYYQTGLSIAVPARGGAGGLAILEALLSSRFLRALGALMLVLSAAGILVWIFERRRNAEQFGGGARKGIGSAFWWSAVTMTTVGYGDKAPRTLGGRAIAVLWMFASVIVIATLTGAIASALTVDSLGTSIRGPDDLSGLRVACVGGSTGEQFLLARGFSTRPVPSAREALRLLAEGGADAAVHDAPLLRYLIHKEFGGSVALVPGTFQRQAYGFALPEGSALREPLNRALLRTIASEAWERIVRRYLGP